jgi:hypothetical protein
MKEESNMSAPLRHPVAVLKERPFDGRLRRLEVDWDHAPSIAEILDAQEDLPQGFRDRCVARVVDAEVPRAMWRHVRPKPCAIRNGKVIDVVVIFSLPLGGPGAGGARGGSGGGAKKNPTATIATVAVLIAATVVSAGALAPLGPAFAAGAIGARLAGAAISLGGGIESRALAPRP